MRRILNYTAQKMRCIYKNTPLLQLDKWQLKGKCSADTALRDINDLLASGELGRLKEGRRSKRIWVGQIKGIGP